MKGLTREEAEERKRLGRQNLPVEAPSKSVGQIVAGNVFTFFNFIFAVLAVCLILVGRYKQMLFLIAVVVNAVIGVVQQLRSKRVVDRLSLLAESSYLTVRDGEEELLPAKELVQDDLVILKAGAQIPADAVVAEGEARVSEALITGEADAVYKREGDELKSGSFGFCAGFFWALYMIFGKKAGMVRGTDSVALGTAVAAMIALPVGLLCEGTALFSPAVLPSGLLVGIFSSALPYGLEMLAMTRLSTQTYGVLTSLEPAMAALSGFVFLGETLTLVQWGALACVMGASLGATLTGRRE